MERRRLAVVLAGLVLVGGAVAALRLTGGTPSPNAAPPPPPLPTVITPYRAEGVLAPEPGAWPAEPDRIAVTPGPRRLRFTWGSANPGGHDPAGVAGYYVRWESAGVSSWSAKLVAEPGVELDGLRPGESASVQVQSVDSFGRRSTAREAYGQALGDPADADSSFVDHFTGAGVPDPRLWRLATVSNCAQAIGSGTRLVLLSECDRSSVTLRSRVPFRLATGGAELGRFTIDTDVPGEDGELDIDLVPGPVAMIGGSPNDPISTTPPNVATIDGSLPPGTIRVRIGAAIDSVTTVPSDTVQVAAGPGVPTVPPSAEVARPIPRPMLGMSARWDVILRTDGIRVLRDGGYVGGGNVVPRWPAATALVEFSGSTISQQRYDVNMIGFGGAPTGATPAAPAPALAPNTFVASATGAAPPPPAGTDTGPGSALLMLTVMGQQATPDAPLTVGGAPPTFTVRIGDTGQSFPVTPAIPGTPLLPEVRYPLVARIPASALAVPSGPRGLPVVLTAHVPAGYTGQFGLQSADIDVTPGEHTAKANPPSSAGITAVPPQLAVLTAKILDASGNPLALGKPLPRGRAVLDVTMDSVAGQRLTGELGGLAGFEVWLDGTELVAVPTAADGPGAGGEWRVAFDVSHGTTGLHTVDIRGFAAQRGVAFGETFVTYELA